MDGKRGIFDVGGYVQRERTSSKRVLVESDTVVHIDDDELGLLGNLCPVCTGTGNKRGRRQQRLRAQTRAIVG